MGTEIHDGGTLTARHNKLLDVIEELKKNFKVENLKINQTPITSVDVVASRILEYCKFHNIEIFDRKLQEIVYVCFGCISAKMKRWLFSEEFTALPVGPCVSCLYYKAQPKANEGVNLATKYVIGKLEDGSLPDEVEVLIKAICKEYLMERTDFNLERITLESGGPYSKWLNPILQEKDDGFYADLLPSQLIVNQFLRLMEGYDKEKQGGKK